MQEMQEMQKYVLITGSSGGIGKELVSKFKRENYIVLGIDRQIENTNDLDYYYQCDLSQEDKIIKTVLEIYKIIPYLNCLVNNAAYQCSASLINTTSHEWDKVMSINLKACYLLVQLCLDKLRLASQSTIVNIASVHSLQTSKNIAAYGISKAALAGLTRTLAIELAPDIRVNSVSPGAIETDMLKEGLRRGHLDGNTDNELLEQLGRKHPINRVGKPNEIANVVYFLASDESSLIVGQNIIADGGATIKLSTE